MKFPVFRPTTSFRNTEFSLWKNVGIFCAAILAATVALADTPTAAPAASATPSAAPEPAAASTPAPSAQPATAATAATPVVAPRADLGQGLGYLRVHALAESLEEAARTLAQGTALVLDLRGATATDASANDFAALLAQRTGPASLFILVSPRTAPELTASLLRPIPHALRVGVAESLPTAQVVVAQPADADQRAYDAYDRGVALDALITGKIEKERFDEAQLVKEFQSGNPNAAPPPEPDPAAPTPDKAPVLTDRVLQRAVHLHRALLALRRS